MSRASESQTLVALPLPQAKDDTISVDWYSPGQTRIVDVAGVRLTIRLVDRKGRRARIAITGLA